MSESSTETPDTATDVKAVADVAPAESSPADTKVVAETPKVEAPADKGEKPTMLEAVKAALKPKPDKSPKSDKPDSESEPKTEDAKKGDEVEVSGELTAEETARLRAKTRKRFEELLKDRSDRDRTIEEISPKAERFDRIAKFFNDANISGDEVNQLFDVGKNLKNNPRKAYEQLTPIFRQLQTMFGDILPEELQQQVARGQMTAERARELAVARTDAGLANQEATRLREQAQRGEVERQSQAFINDVKTKVTEWESSKEKSDPDWKQKAPFVMQAVQAELLKPGRTKLPTAAEAIEIATQALAQVENNLKSFAPRKREIRPITDVTSKPSTAKPSSALEAAHQGLAKAHATA